MTRPIRRPRRPRGLYGAGVTFTIDEVVRRLRAAGVSLDKGLTDRSVREIEKRFNFTFGLDHRRLLETVQPTGDRWVDWRHADDQELQVRLGWPTEGVIFDVHNSGFWARSWGDRPADREAAEEIAREQLRRAPRLVPLYGHRFLPAAPADTGSPVFSVYQTDVIYYGDNLLDYVAHEFRVGPLHPTDPADRTHVYFWSDLAEGATDTDL